MPTTVAFLCDDVANNKVGISRHTVVCGFPCQFLKEYFLWVSNLTLSLRPQEESQCLWSLVLLNLNHKTEPGLIQAAHLSRTSPTGFGGLDVTYP